MSILSLNNGIYKVSVEETPADGGGLYTIATGPAHPYWPNQSIFYGGAEETPWSSYVTVRSFTSMTDYTSYDWFSDTDPGYAKVLLEPVGTTVRLGNSIQTIFTLTRPLYPDDLTIVQTVALNGTAYINSVISVTTSVTNTGSVPVMIGIRYLWDYALADNDMTVFRQMDPSSSPLTAEQTFAPAAFNYYQMSNPTGSPRMFILGTANGPGSLVPAPVPPEQLEYASWINASAHVFTYATTGPLENGSCVLYYWGNPVGIVIPAGETSGVTASLFANRHPPQRGIRFLN